MQRKVGRTAASGPRRGALRAQHRQIALIGIRRPELRGRHLVQAAILLRQRSRARRRRRQRELLPRPRRIELEHLPDLRRSHGDSDVTRVFVLRELRDLVRRLIVDVDAVGLLDVLLRLVHGRHHAGHLLAQRYPEPYRRADCGSQRSAVLLADQRPAGSSLRDPRPRAAAVSENSALSEGHPCGASGRRPRDAPGDGSEIGAAIKRSGLRLPDSIALIADGLPEVRAHRLHVGQPEASRTAAQLAGGRSVEDFGDAAGRPGPSAWNDAKAERARRAAS